MESLVSVCSSVSKPQHVGVLATIIPRLPIYTDVCMLKNADFRWEVYDYIVRRQFVGLLLKWLCEFNYIQLDTITSDEFIWLLPENDIPLELVIMWINPPIENAGSNTSPGFQRDGNRQVVTENNLVTPGFNMSRIHYSLLGNVATIDIC